MIWGTELAHIISEPAIPNISKKCAVFISHFPFCFKNKKASMSKILRRPTFSDP